MNNSPIGVIDSGIGGLSVLKYLLATHENEHFVYFADSAYCPYGRKEYHELQHRVIKIVDFLINKHNVKLVVVACNTATAAAIDTLRATFKIPFVGMEPAIKPAALSTISKVIGVLATEGTFNGRLFKETTERFASEIKVIVQAGNGLVELIERDETDGEEIKKLLLRYITPMIEANADLLVLGCTHFPFLETTISQLFPEIELIDPAPAIARQTYNILKQNNILAKQNNSNTIFYTSGNTELFNKFLINKLNIKAQSIKSPL